MLYTEFKTEQTKSYTEHRKTKNQFSKEQVRNADVFKP